MNSIFSNNKYFYLFMFCVFILLTNIYFPFDLAVTICGQADMQSYYDIAHSAPFVPEHTIAYHHAQRAYLPFLLGSIANLFSLNPDFLVMAMNSLLLVGMILVFMKTIEIIGVDENLKILLLALICLNPYISRYFSLFYYMVNDTLFMFGFVLVVYAMVANSVRYLLIGVLLAALGRQTALLLLPAASIYLFMYHNGHSKIKALLAVAFIVFSVVAIYMIGGYFAGLTGAKNQNASSVTSFFLWLSDFKLSKLKILAEFYIRGLVGQITIVVLFVVYYFVVRPKYFDKLFLLIVFLSVSVWIQPLLAGPDNAGNNIVRLCIYSFPGLVVAFALLSTKNYSIKLNIKTLTVVVLLLALTSIHHRWSWIGSLAIKEPQVFGAVTYLVSLGIALVFFLAFKNNIKDRLL